MPIAFTDKRYSDSDPWLTPDGRTLYFVSNRPVTGEAPKADLDIWRSTRTAAGWSKPEHLPDLASPGPELGVELHGNSLFFASVRKGGQGGLDIYVARRDGARFAAPQLLGGPFNTATSESDFTLSRDGRTALFWRMVGQKGVLHLSRRSAGGWSAPVALGPEYNPGDFNFTPSFVRGGRSFSFASTALRPGQSPGMADVYIAKLLPHPK